MNVQHDIGSYHSTNQYRHAIRAVLHDRTFVGTNKETNKPIYEPELCRPVEYVGTVKLHGTNASVVFHEDGSLTFHSKNRLLALMTSAGEVTTYMDNASFAQTFCNLSSDSYIELCKLLRNAVGICVDINGEIKYPIQLSGEWAGAGCSKGTSDVAICKNQNKAFYVFGLKFGDRWMPIEWLNEVFPSSPDAASTESLEKMNRFGLYNILQFQTFSIRVDPQNPIQTQQTIVDYVEQVEKSCPVGKQLGYDGIGEGIVWTPKESQLISNTDTWFKTKGHRHSVTKVKTLAAVDVEKLNNAKTFVEYAVTENRVMQAIVELGLDVEHFESTNIGNVIRWDIGDVEKEETDTLLANNLTIKDVGRGIADSTRKILLSL